MHDVLLLFASLRSCCDFFFNVVFIVIERVSLDAKVSNGRCRNENILYCTAKI